MGAVASDLKLPANMQGMEKGTAHKPWDEARVRVLLAHPDRYEVAAGSAAISILYQLVNRHPNYLAERAFLLAGDVRSLLRQQGLRQFSLESRHAITAFDLLGISMPTELLYPNLVQFLRDAGLSPWAARRGEHEPLVAAGGVASFNPLPIAPLVDLVFVGEAEESLIEVLALLETKKHLAKAEKLAALARIPGIYVPRIHQREMQVVSKRALRDLTLLTDLTDPVIPYGSEDMPRSALQLTRGCAWKCRYCQAGFTTLPLRYLSVDQVAQTVEKLHQNGIREVSLLALNAIDYPHLESLATQLNDKAQGVRVPSIKMDRVDPELIRPLGNMFFSHALEAGTERLRRAINRPYTDADSDRAVEHILILGGEHIYMDFMIGLPTESDADVIGIAHTVARVADRVRGRAKLTVSVSPFVPKPHTPLQWHVQLLPAELRRRAALLDQYASQAEHVTYRLRDPEPSLIEGLFARGDEQVSHLVVKAAEQGVVDMDWNNRFKEEEWLKLGRQCGLDVHALVQHSYTASDDLPWDVINVGIQKKFFVREWERTLAE